MEIQRKSGFNWGQLNQGDSLSWGYFGTLPIEELRRNELWVRLRYDQLLVSCSWHSASDAGHAMHRRRAPTWRAAMQVLQQLKWDASLDLFDHFPLLITFCARTCTPSANVDVIFHHPCSWTFFDQFISVQSDTLINILLLFCSDNGLFRAYFLYCCKYLVQAFNAVVEISRFGFQVAGQLQFAFWRVQILKAAWWRCCLAILHLLASTPRQFLV